MWFLSPPVPADESKTDKGTEEEKEKEAPSEPGPPVLAPSDVLVRPFKDVTSALETARSYLEKKLPPEHEGTFSSRKGEDKKGKGREDSAMGMALDESAASGSVPMEPKMSIEHPKAGDRSRATSEISVVSFTCCRSLSFRCVFVC